MLTNLIFLNKLRHVLLILCHKLNISTYVDNIDLKENNNFVKKCIEKSYFCKKCDTCVYYTVSQLQLYYAVKINGWQKGWEDFL